MDTDAVKTAISILSALVAVFGAVSSYQIRNQTRRDTFESQRDSVLLAIADSDNRAAYLVLRAETVIDELARLSREASAAHTDEASRLTVSLREIANTVVDIVRRDLDEQRIEGLQYSESALAELRRLTRAEVAITKALRNESFELVYGRAAELCAKLRATT